MQNTKEMGNILVTQRNLWLNTNTLWTGEKEHINQVIK